MSEDLKWYKNTNNITQKAMKRIWILRRLKKIGSSVSFMTDVYIKEIRSLLEQSVPLWHNALTLTQDAQIERVKKTTLYVILGNSYINYEDACSLSGLDTLKQRRESLCYGFAKKNLKSNDILFTKDNITLNLRRDKQKVKEYFCNTKRFEKSPLPYLAKLLNSNAG